MTLQRTVDTLIELDEPEALIATIRREAERKSGPRWQALSRVLAEAEIKLDQNLNAKPAGPNFMPNNEASAIDNLHKPLNELVGQKPEPVNTDAEAKAE
jgi:hypothetical protein